MALAREIMASICATPEFAKVSAEELRWQERLQESFCFLPDWRRSLHARSLREQHVQRFTGEIVLDRPRWWIEFEADETKRNEWVEAIAASVAKETLRDAVGDIVGRLYPSAKRLIERYEASRASESGVEHGHRLSGLLQHWPTEISASRVSYYVIADHCLRVICATNDIVWPDGWGTISCVCTSLHQLVEEATARCVHVVQQPDANDAIPALKTYINEVRSETELTRQYVAARLELLVHEYKLQSSLESPVIAPGPVDNFFIIDNSKLLLGFPSSLSVDLQLPRRLKLDVDRDGAVNRIASLDGRCINSNCLSRAFTSLVPLFNRALAHLATRPPLTDAIDLDHCARFALPSPRVQDQLPMEAAAPFTLNGASCRIVARLISCEVTESHNTDYVWHSTPPSSDRDNSVLASGFVILQVDNLTNPRVRYHSEMHYVDGHDLYHDPPLQQSPICRAPATLCWPKGESIAAVTALAGRFLVFPPYLQYQLVPSSRLDQSIQGSMVVLAVDLLNPVMSSLDDPVNDTGRLGCVETEVETSMTASIGVGEGKLQVHYPQQNRVTAISPPRGSPIDVNPLVFRTSKSHDKPRTPADNEFRAWIAGFLDQPHWWDEIWGKPAFREQLLTAFVSRYLAVRIGSEDSKCMEVISFKLRKSDAYDRAATNEEFWCKLQATTPLREWFQRLCGNATSNESAQWGTCVRDFREHPHTLSTAHNSEGGFSFGKSISFMSTSSGYSFEELRSHQYSQRAQAAEQSMLHPHNPYRMLVWLIYHTTILVRTLQPRNAGRKLRTFSYLWIVNCELILLSCRSYSLRDVILSEPAQWSNEDDFSAAVLVSLGFPVELVPHGVRTALATQVKAIQHEMMDCRDRVRLMVASKVVSTTDGRLFTDSVVQEVAICDGWIASELQETLMNQCDPLSIRLTQQDVFSTQHHVRPLIDPSMFLCLAGKTRRLRRFSVPRARSTKEMIKQFDRVVGFEPADIVRSTSDSQRWIPSDVRINIDGSIEFTMGLQSLRDEMNAIKEDLTRVRNNSSHPKARKL